MTSGEPTLVGLLNAQAERTPAAIAVSWDGGAWSHATLHARANHVARVLRDGCGAGADTRVAVCLERGPSLVAALVGVLKAGAAYVPLDPEYPAERLEYILRHSGAVALVADQAPDDRLRHAAVPLVPVDGETADEAPVQIWGDQAAYVIYTSGSTGRPKGVVNAHRSICNTLQWMQDTYHLDASDVVLQKTSASFDVSVWELFWPLITGARLHLARPGGHRDARYLVDVMRRERVTTVHFVPSMLRAWLDEPGIDTCVSLTRVICSGEALPRSAQERFERRHGAVLINQYGPTEASIDATWWRCERGTRDRTVPIGRPIANMQAHVLDGTLRPAPPGTAGELWLSGVGLARGYLGRPELTAERFVANPIDGVPGDRLYRTGDLARFRDDGALEYLGRIDGQVKIRGLRIELGEIESVLREHAGVSDAVVVAEGEDAARRLIAFVTRHPNGSLQIGDLRRWATQKLPDYMVPSRFVPVDRIPLTPNGKVDRRALASAGPTRADLSRAYAPPGTRTETRLAGLWAEILDLETPGIDDDFLELGGHSLLAMQIVARGRRMFEIDLPPHALFEAPTIRQLAARIDHQPRTADAPPIVAGAEDAPAPLTFAQQRLWFLQQLAPDDPSYNVPEAIRLRGAIDVPALQRAFDEIVRRHAVLRARIEESENGPLQIVGPDTTMTMPVTEIDGDSETLRAERVGWWAFHEASTPFDLSRAPLLRARLLRLAETDHVLLLTTHHIASDGWSMGVLLRELSALYGACREGAPSPLAPLPIQYADYARWQRTALDEAALAAELTYWRGQLADAADLVLPTDRPRPAVARHRGASEPVTLDVDLVRELKALSRKAGTTLFMTLLAGFDLLLQRYSGQDDIIVGTPIAGRMREETEGLIGCFINTLPLRANLAGNPSVLELLAGVKRTALEAYAHQQAPFEKLVEELQPERDASRNPIFQVMFAMQNAPASALTLPGVETSAVAAHGGTARFDLTLVLAETAGGNVVGTLEYDADLYDRASVARLGAHWRRLLAGMAADAEARIGTLALLEPAERAALLVAWNDTAQPYDPAQCLHALVAAQAAATPAAIAVEYDGTRVSYAELLRRANQTAHYLRRLGVGPETRVGVCVERSVDLLVAILGILTAGGAYVPLDPAYPPARVAFIAHDAALTVLVSEARLLARLPALTVPVVCLDRDAAAIGTEPSSAPPAGPADPAHAAYIIYTSGSTGQPKGVLVAHAGLANLAAAQKATFGCGPGTRILQFAPLTFDASIFEIGMALTAGATLCLSDRQSLMPGPELAALLRRERIGLVTLPPSALAQLDPDTPLEQLHTIVVAGEAFPAELAAQWAAGRALFNAYGPTEATVWSTVERVRPGADSVSIGRPIANTRIYVLDEAMQPVPVGVPGQLYIAGAGLARGYLHRPALTAERFVANPYGDEHGGRLHRTGDVVRYRSDGTLDFVGRADGQVKIRGHRIDVGEVESALRQQADVREAVVMAEGSGSDRRLVAHVVGQAGRSLRAPELRRRMQDTLPEYMVPARFVVRDHLPLTPHGKIDRRSLAASVVTRAELSGGYVPPRSIDEVLLAAIWVEVLKVRHVGIDDNFFELGGHSLLATRLVSRIRSAFDVDLPLQAVFDSPTVRGLARRLAGGMGGAPSSPIVPAPHGEPAPLSFAQQRLWFLQRLVPEDTSYNVLEAVRLRGAIDAPALERSLGEIVRRHAVLRTRVDDTHGRPAQVVEADAPVRLSIVDVSREAARDDQVQWWARQEATTPFDAGSVPLLRARLLRLGDADHVLLLTTHHIASDGWSMGVLLSELRDLYAACRAGDPSPLPELPIQYADFARWQRERLQGAALDAALAYWRAQLAGAAPLELPADRPRPAVQRHRGGSARVVLPAPLVRSLHGLSRDTGTTLFMTLLAGFDLLLHRYSGQDDIIVGTPIAGRMREETEGLIGCFVNTLPLRASLAGNPTVRELLARVKRTALGAYAHQEMPFEQLVDALQPVRDLSRNPIFQVAFAMQNTPASSLVLDGIEASRVEVDSATAQFDLLLSVSEGADGDILGTLEYDADLYDGATVARLGAHWRRLLSGMAADAEARIGTLALLEPAERAALLVAWNDTAQPYDPAQCLHALVAAQAAATPAAIAVEYDGTRVSYAELLRRANQTAHYLRRLGVGPETRVGVCVERSVDVLVAILGILTAGGAYVPLDPAYPPARVAFIAHDAALTALVSESRLLARLPALTVPVVCLDRDAAAIGTEASAAPPAGPADPAHAAYIIYTSGSTGQPKGVVITHRSAHAFLHWCGHEFDDRIDVIAATTSICFDLSIFEIFFALTTGRRLRLLRSALDLPAHLAAGDRLLVNTVPSVVKQLQDGGVDLGGIAALNMAGEPIPGDVAQRLPAGVPVRNLYGPSEDTTYSTCHRLQHDGDHHLIGRPIGNRQAYLLDRHLRPVPIGVTGELYLGGDGLARGYWNRPGLTAERFIANPYSGESGARLYRTGDLARFTAGGALDFLGRLDGQVKIRGYRIEAGEIEVVLGQHPDVRDAIVIARDTDHGKELVAYLVRRDAAAPASALHGWLAEKLPHYMLPSRFVDLPSLPLTPNGKIDRAALPAPEPAHGDARGGYVAPRTEQEAVLAGIWADVLGRDRVGVDDNFFALGGDSILSIQIVARAHRAGLQLTARQLFQNQTVAQLAAAAGRRRDARAEQGRVSGPVALTPIQRWFFEQPLVDRSHYNQAMLVELRRPVDAAALERAVDACIAHHDALRMRYVADQGGWQQVNLAEEPHRIFTVEDLSGIQPDRLAAAIAQRAAAAQQSLDIERGPLARVVLFEAGPALRARLFIVIQHLVVDAVSWRILLEDLERAYEHASAGRAIDLGPKTSSYRQWAERLREYADGVEVSAERGRWLDAAQAAPGAPVEWDEPGADVAAAARDLVVGLGEEETRALLQDVPAAYRTHINDVLIAALALALSRWQRSRRVRIDLEGHGREELFANMDVSRTIGWFTTLFPVVVDLPSSGHAGDMLPAVKEQLRRVPRGGVGYGALRYLSGDPELAQRLAGRADVCFNYLGQLDGLWPARSMFAPGLEDIGPLQSPRNRRSHPIEINGHVANGRLQLVWTYNERRHPRAVVERVAADFIAALTDLVRHCQSVSAPGATPSDFPLADLDAHALAHVLRTADQRTAN